MLPTFGTFRRDSVQSSSREATELVVGPEAPGHLWRPDVFTRLVKETEGVANKHKPTRLLATASWSHAPVAVLWNFMVSDPQSDTHLRRTLADLGQLRPGIGKMWSELARIGRKWARVDSGQTGPHNDLNSGALLCNVGFSTFLDQRCRMMIVPPPWHTFGRVRANLARFRPRFGLCRARIWPSQG